jgi:hypothetical protein
MSALGQKLTSAGFGAMSGKCPRTDMPIDVDRLAIGTVG